MLKKEEIKNRRYKFNSKKYIRNLGIQRNKGNLLLFNFPANSAEEEMTLSRTKHPTLLIGPISVLEMQRPSSKQKTNDDFFFFLGQLRYRSVIYHLDRCRYAVTGLDSFLRGRGGWISGRILFRGHGNTK